MAYISIIVPFNKSKRFLKDCLDSIYEQKLEDYEIILILNGVREDISDILNEFNEKLNLIIKEFEEEITVSKARNEGLNIARGKYIYFNDSDDYIYKDGLSKLIEVSKETDADFINGERFTTAFVRDRFGEEFLRPNRIPLKKGKLTDEEYSFQLLVGDKTNYQEVLSVLHALIKKEAIGDFRFDETKRYYSDYDFFNQCLQNIKTFVGVEDSIYAKRARDDSVNFTSLNQEPKKDTFLLYLNEYKKTVSVIDKLNNNIYNLLKDEMAYSYYKYYKNTFTYRFKNGAKRWRNKYFKAFQEISKDFPINRLNFIEKQEVKAFQNNKIKIMKAFMNTRLGIKNFKKITKSREAFYLYLYQKYYNPKNVNENQILFISFNGKFYSDSPKYIYEYLYENYGDKFEYVWVMNDKNVEIPGNPKKVKRFSNEYFKEVAKSKYWVTNGRQALRLKKKNDQIILSTWHGTPLKKIGFDIGNAYAKDPNIKKVYKRVGDKWDYLISPSEFVTEKLRSSFAYDGVILQEGYPRNDILYNATESDINKLKEKLNIPKDKKVILYAPTWRDDKFVGDGEIDFQLEFDLDKLNESLKDDYVLLIKTHYFVGNELDLSKYEGFIYNVSHYDDIAELYLISDILITDYSSVFFDFANLKKPILFYTYDLDRYENVLRGFYIDIHKDVPGPLLFTTEEVIYSIINIDSIEEEYADKYDEFYERFCSIDDGNASKRIVEKVFK